MDCAEIYRFERLADRRRFGIDLVLAAIAMIGFAAGVVTVSL
ncbi:MAG: hypothetical protein AB7L41_00345 [Flavobacteriaceae bacterium]